MNVSTIKPARDAFRPTPSLMPITVRPDAVMVRGKGSYLWDKEHRP